MKKVIVMFFVLGMCFVMNAQEKPNVFGINLFQDCQELERSDTFKELGLKKMGAGPLEKKYYAESATVGGIEVGKISVFVGKNEKNRMKRLEAEQKGHEFPYKEEEDPFLKSSEGYVVLGVEFAFRPNKWKEVLDVLKKSFGKPKEEKVNINEKIKSVRVNVMWELQDGGTLNLRALSVLGTASVYYNSNW